MHVGVYVCLSVFVNNHKPKNLYTYKIRNQKTLLIPT